MLETTSSTVLKVKSFSGTWWIPESNQRWYGTLTFEIMGEQSLKIISESEELLLTQDDSSKIFHGNCIVDGFLKCVTVFHALRTRSSSHENDPNTLWQYVFSVNDIWISDVHFLKREDVKFTSFSFEMHNLEYWLNEKNVFKVQKNSETIAVSMKRLPVIKLFEDENVEIEINYHYNYPYSTLVQLATSMSYCPKIKIISKCGYLPYYGQQNSFEYYWQCIYDFISLCIGGYTYFFNMLGFKGDTEKNVNSKVLFSCDITAKQRKNIYPSLILFPYCELKDDWEKMIKKFFNQHSQVQHIYAGLQTCLHTFRYVPYMLPNLLYGLEGLQQSFYPDLDDPNNAAHSPQEDEYLQKVNTIIALCPPELVQFAKDAMMKKVPYYKRVRGMIEDVASFFPFLATRKVIQKLSFEIGQMRITAAHSQVRTEALDTNVIYFIFFIQYLQIAIIMKALGLAENKIKKCYSNNSIGDLQGMQVFFKQCYASKGDKK